MFEGILAGLGELAQPVTLIALFGGTLLGLIVGSLPGLNDSITMAVLIPITFGMSREMALGLLIGIYCASACGGSIPAILLKIPGTASECLPAKILKRFILKEKTVTKIIRRSLKQCILRQERQD